MQTKIYKDVKWTGDPEVDAVLAIKAWMAAARPNQLLNLNRSYGYLMMSGRGFGKTQTLSGNGITAGLMTPNMRIAVVARTNSDARGTLFFGDSGLENNIPVSCIKTITKKPLEIHLWNGTAFYGYSAEEPKGLRGPNFHLALCVAKGTKVSMGDGSQKSIEDIKPGELVMTRKGPRKVICGKRTGILSSTLTIQTESGILLSCTPNHPIYSNGEFVRADELRAGDELCRLLSTQGRSGTRPILTTTCVTRMAGTRPCFIGRYIKISMGALSRVTTSITKMVTGQTTQSKIWKCLVSGSTIFGTTTEIVTNGQTNKERTLQRIGWLENLSRVSAQYVRRSSSPVLENQVNGVVSDVGEGPQSQGLLRKYVSASIVRSLTSLRRLGKSIAQRCVTLVREVNPTISGGETAHNLETLAARAAPKLSAQSEKTQSSVEETAPYTTTDRVAHISESPEPIDVYDIQVEDAHEFFSNNILVHNCDELAHWTGLGEELEDPFEMIQMATRLPSPYETKMIAATTPDDVDLLFQLEQDPTFTKIYGSTYENQDNLDDSFLRKIQTKEGTSLGDMEIHGRLMRRGGAAIFKKEQIKRWPFNKPLPHFQFVLQSWDTAFTAESHNDPSACTTWGVFHTRDDGYGIMLIDAFRLRMEFPELQSRMQQEYATGKGPNANIFVDVVLLEASPAGLALYQSLQRTRMNIIPYSVMQGAGGRDKVARANLVSPVFERGDIYVPSDRDDLNVAPWALEWLEELVKFSSSKKAIKTQKDDYVDSTTQAVDYIEKQGYGRSIVDRSPTYRVESPNKPYKNPYLI
jgi:predicted phage terminase large subunit-like protein